MSEQTASVVDAPAPEAPPAPKKEHWKVRQKREREEAAARGEAPPVEAPKAAAPAKEPTGFHSWTAFCNAVSVEILMTQQGRGLLASFGTSDEDIAANFTGFHGIMAKAYKVLRMAWKHGITEFGE